MQVKATKMTKTTMASIMFKMALVDEKSPTLNWRAAMKTAYG